MVKPKTLAVAEIGGVNIVKLIGSIMVVMIHTQPFYMTDLNYYVFCLCTMAVPYFFVISSYFYYKNGQQWKYIKRLLILYVVWLIIELPIVYYRFFHNDDTFVFNITKLLRKFISGSLFPGSWYLMALMEGMIFIKIIQRWLNNWWLLFISGIFYVLCLLSSSYSFLVENVAIWVTLNKWITFGNSFFVGVIYIVIGKILSERKLQNKNILLGFFFILWIIEFSLLKSDYKNTGCFLILPVFTFLLVVKSLNSQIQIDPIVSNIIRKSSTLIYLFHFIAVFVFSHLFKMHLGIVLFVLTLFVSVLFSIFICKFADKHRILRYLY